MRIIQIFGREKRKFEEFNDKNYKLYRAFYREMMVFAEIGRASCRERV